jgi:transposase
VHELSYRKVRTLRDQIEKIKLENRCLREILFSLTGGNLSRAKTAPSVSYYESVLWMSRLLQNVYPFAEAENEIGKVAGWATLLEDAKSEKKRVRNYAISILAQCRGIRRSTVARFLHISRSSVYRYWERFHNIKVHSLDTQHQAKTTKATNEVNIAAVFSVLHSPPSEFGINRTSWIMADLKKCLAEQKVYLGLAAIRTIIRGAGYTWRRAKTVLTSNDPLYRKKLMRIQAVLSSLREDERFFSIDEFGPFAIKMKGGRRLVAPNEYPSVPQFQKSKGWLILTAALELSTNQVTHFYSRDKNTNEMTRLLDILLTKYQGCSTLYLSWDAASWHVSKKLKHKVYRINTRSYHDKHGTPKVRLVPLPASAQFLNVIESVFSGMARAIIHNSNYGSVDEVKLAIDRYFKERNEYFQKHPKAAGMKIWGRETSQSQFSETNNCKDRRFR